MSANLMASGAQFSWEIFKQDKYAVLGQHMAAAWENFLRNGKQAMEIRDTKERITGEEDNEGSSKT